ncbi:hypothetical protein LKO27_03540 [Tessaracoccus sp. OS52]|uniref:hypothetical protein n=1 Tax=Tessaracoccus sp. OS52 TaxID=2886691 RepID=UPI001D11D7CB|nr:hypothetical protein [Tessaracoccus sp. OS52]MCC2592494.1 hypothetical protein [Tessaracoccus sp. OS52]
MNPNLFLLGGVLVMRSRVRRRDRWDRRRLLGFQHAQLRRLLDYARAHSPYYSEVLDGKEGAPLSALPVLTKKDLMRHWDRICTSADLRLADVEQRLRDLQTTGDDPARAWRRRWLAATGGTTGVRATFAWNRREWTRVLASYARVNDWADVHVGPGAPLRTVIVSSRDPSHQSAVVGASLRSGIVPTLRLDAHLPVKEMVAQINAFQPRLLVAYSSLVGPLANAQLEGTLQISPEKVVAASEVLPAPARAAAMSAWGHHALVDTYAATETAGIASTCSRGGWHLYEDFVIIEPVDSSYQPVPAGSPSERVLVTVLFSRTLPLIRYELTDSVRLSTANCSCGLPFALLESVDGRSQDTLTLPGHDREVRVHPVVFATALQNSAPNGWQVEQHSDHLLVRLVSPVDDPHQAGVEVEKALRNLGVETMPIEVVAVDGLRRTRLGKAPLVTALVTD